MRRIVRFAVVIAALASCDQSQDLGSNDHDPPPPVTPGILCVGPLADFKVDDHYLYCLSENCVAAVDKAGSTTLGDLVQTDYCTDDIEARSVAGDGDRVYVAGVAPSESMEWAGYIYSAAMVNSGGASLAPLFGGNAGDSDDPKRFMDTSGALVDASRIFWATENAIMVAPKVGAAEAHDYSILAPAVSPLDPAMPFVPYGPRFAQDETNVYWVEPGRLMTIAKTGGSAIALVAVPGELRSVATAGGWVYFTSCVFNGPGHVGRVSPVSHAVEHVESQSVCAFTGVAADETYVYWTESSGCDDKPTGGGSVMRAPVGGGDKQVFAADQECPSYMLIDTTAVYWMTNGPVDGEVVRRAPK